MQSFRSALLLLSELTTNRLASNAAASCSATSTVVHSCLRRIASGPSIRSRHFASDGDYSQAPPGAVTDNSKEKSVENSLEAELPRVRAKRLKRAEKYQYVGNEEFEEEIKNSSILVEPDIPIYDLREVMQQVGFPLEPRAPLFDKLQELALDSPEVVSLLQSEQEEEAPFPGARRILQWEQRIVLSHGNFTGNHPVNRKAKCTVYLRDLQEQTSLTDEALQLVARVCGPRYDAKTGLLTLVSEKYNMREENRRHIMETLVQLVSEGHKAFPIPGAPMPAEQGQEQQAA